MRFKVTPGFCALVCFLGWFDWRLCLWFLACLLIHETGHLLAMKLLHVPLQGFFLQINGAILQAGCMSYRQELLCAAAGPAASAAAAAAWLQGCPEFAILHGCMAVVNLLPLYPLDGGRMLRAALCLWVQEKTAVKVLRVSTYVVCCFLMVLACWITTQLQAGLWPILAALVLLCKVGTANLEECEKVLLF